MFIRNCWYVAALAGELSTQPLGRKVLGEPVVLYRTAGGKAVALEDRCCHRFFPLSHGEVHGEELMCTYHGLTYDASGRCIRIPGQSTVPPNAWVRSFPLVEQDGMAWIWMGDPALADPASIVPYPWHSDARWAWRGMHYPLGCHYELIHDNLLDLSHVGYVHGRTIGGTPDAHSNAEMKTAREGERVVVRRWLRDSVPPPTYVRAVGFAGRIDRWMEISFVPGLIWIYIGANDAGVGLDEEGRHDKLGIRIFNGITPETADTSHYFWTAAHNFRVGEPAVTQAFCAEIEATFQEDRAVIEAQQARMRELPDRPRVDIRGDAGGLAARRVVAARLRAEAQAPVLEKA